MIKLVESAPLTNSKPSLPLVALCLGSDKSRQSWQATTQLCPITQGYQRTPSELFDVALTAADVMGQVMVRDVARCGALVKPRIHTGSL